MRRVIIESPLSGNFARNIRYARLCMLDCLRRGEAPFASHLLYTQVWDDLDDDLRAKGIAAGHEWYGGADACVVYRDFGISKGMARGIKAASAAVGGILVETRCLAPDLMLVFRIGDEPDATEGAT